MSNCHNVGIQNVTELPLDDLDSVPEAFLAIREFEDKTVFTRFPGNRLMPNGTLNNIFSLPTNNRSLTVPENQVLPAYVANEGSQDTVMPADGSHKALFLVIAVQGDYAACQNAGVISILAGHNYIIGQQYYLDENGGVSTSTKSGQKLFIPISKTKLLLNISY